MSGTHPQVSRRTVAKGAAWTVPAITIAAAGPTPVPNKPGVYEYLVLGESSSNWLTINYTFAGSDPQEVTISTRPQCSDYQF